MIVRELFQSLDGWEARGDQWKVWLIQITAQV
jgi:hypothetical protein